MRSKLVKLGVLACALVVAPAAALALGDETTPAARPLQQPAPSFGYVAPTGPELAPATVSADAVAYAREAHETGEIGLQMAHSTLAQAEAVMEGEAPSAGATRAADLRAAVATGSARFCFSACTPEEESQARRARSEEAESSVYLVTMTGRKFSPVEHLKRGAREITGKTVSMIIDAHTGAYRDLLIGGKTSPTLGALGKVSAWTAAAQSNTARTATASSVPTIERASRAGSIDGSLNVRGDVVVLSRGSVLARTTPIHGTFNIHIRAGSYRIAARRPSGRFCGSERVVVAPRRETRVHLHC